MPHALGESSHCSQELTQATPVRRWNKIPRRLPRQPAFFPERCLRYDTLKKPVFSCSFRCAPNPEWCADHPQTTAQTIRINRSRNAGTIQPSVHTAIL